MLECIVYKYVHYINKVRNPWVEAACPRACHWMTDVFWLHKSWHLKHFPGNVRPHICIWWFHIKDTGNFKQKIQYHSQISTDRVLCVQLWKRSRSRDVTQIHVYATLGVTCVAPAYVKVIRRLFHDSASTSTLTACAWTIATRIVQYTWRVFWDWETVTWPNNGLTNMPRCDIFISSLSSL